MIASLTFSLSEMYFCFMSILSLIQTLHYSPLKVSLCIHLCLYFRIKNIWFWIEPPKYIPIVITFLIYFVIAKWCFSFNSDFTQTIDFYPLQLLYFLVGLPLFESNIYCFNTIFSIDSCCIW